MELVFLGTGASIPSKQRSLPSIAVRRGSDVTLLDCGEGTQRQLMISPLSFMKVERILLSHLHGDHVLGIPGLLQTMGLSGRERPLTLLGPNGTEEALDIMLGLCHGEIPFHVDVKEMSDGDGFQTKGMSISTVKAEHGMESLSFILREDDRPGRFHKDKASRLGIPEGPLFAMLQKGQEISLDGRLISPEDVCGPVRVGLSLAYSGDTLPNDRFREEAHGVDVMVHEATFADAEVDLAKTHFHSTASQAAEMARSAEAGCLILTHISSRYKDASVLLDEARRIFPNTHLAEDMASHVIGPR